MIHKTNKRYEHAARNTGYVHGFSLVELSIVLVILGLLTGGILTGQSLIRAAELRAIPMEYQSYNTAIQTFRDKYFAYPGDMTNAIDFWGDNSTECSDGDATNNGTPGTCNGNGDGILLVAGAASSPGESFMFWNQLALAGLIEGSYDGLSEAASGADATIGANVPASRLSGAGWATNSWDASGGGSGWDYAIDYGNFVIFGAETAPGNGPHDPILTPEEAWNIDTKIDDGKPAWGKVVAKYWNEACASRNSGAAANTNFDADYNVLVTTPQCALYFKDIF